MRQNQFAYRILAGLLLLLAGQANSLACSCRPFEIEKAYQEASYVFSALLTKAQLAQIHGSVGQWEFPGILASPFVLAEFEQARFYKGNAGDLAGVITYSNFHTSCGLAMTVGEEYLFVVYSSWDKFGWLRQSRYGIVSHCSSRRGGHQVYRSAIEWLEQQHHGEVPAESRR